MKKLEIRTKERYVCISFNDVCVLYIYVLLDRVGEP